MISEIKANFKNQVWNLLYTDGSKSQYQLSVYAVVDDERSLILGTLYEHASVFTAEFCAIYQAVRLYSKRTAILTDSLSVLRAISSPFNNKWKILSHISYSLIGNENRIKLQWIPSHIGIESHLKLKFKETPITCYHYSHPITCYHYTPQTSQKIKSNQMVTEEINFSTYLHRM